MPHPGLWDAQHAVYQHHHRPSLPNLHQTFCSIKRLNVNKQDRSCETPAKKKATTKPNNLLCPSTKVQLGKQEWLALANVGKTTCKISQHKMDPKHHTKPLLYTQKWSQIWLEDSRQQKENKNQSFLCLVTPRRSSTKRIEMNDAANIQRSFRICLETFSSHHESYMP